MYICKFTCKILSEPEDLQDLFMASQFSCAHTQIPLPSATE